MKYVDVNLNELSTKKMHKIIMLLKPDQKNLDRANKMLTEHNSCDLTNISTESQLLFAAQILNTAWNCMVSHPDFLDDPHHDEFKDIFINQVIQIIGIITGKEIITGKGN